MAQNDQEQPVISSGAVAPAPAEGEAVLDQNAKDIEEHVEVGLHPHAHAAGHAGMLAALGVVFGDIGTSPIYTLDTAFKAGVLQPDPVQVEGFLSLIVWSLFFVVGVRSEEHTSELQSH